MKENNIQIFENKNFGFIRTEEINSKIYFCGSDVAKALGYARPNDAISAHCRCTVKRSIPHPQSKNKTIQMLFISEGDVYRLIASSKLPTAQKFESWVFDEVLPTIRKTGGYVANEDLFVNTYLPHADENTKSLFRLQLQTINQLNHRIEKDKPLVEFAGHIQTSEDCISMNDMAKLACKNGIEIGRNKLFAFLRNNKVLTSDNIPYQRYIEQQPWFQVKENACDDKYGKTRIFTTTVVTPKGQVGIVRMLKKNFQTKTVEEIGLS